MARNAETDLITVRGREFLYRNQTFTCTIGRNGFSVQKREGDGCTPIGTFALRECWMRADRITIPKLHLPTHITEPDDGWCDDPKSALYNKHIKIKPSSSPSPSRGEGRGGGDDKLLTHAKDLRSNMTEAEKKLWHELRAHRFEDYGFRRQCPMGGKYIVDFFCPKHKLIIEADGGQHADSSADLERDRFLQQEGYRVLRFWNHEIMDNMAGVLETILQALQTPSLTLPPEGGGKIAAQPASFEHLWRDDGVYDLIVPLGYNDDPIKPGLGSAIFLHISRPDGGPTEGCVALQRDALLKLLPQFSPQTRIRIDGE